jgi:hypothetical protein
VAVVLKKRNPTNHCQLVCCSPKFRRNKLKGGTDMLKTFTVAAIAISVSAGLAQAHFTGHKHKHMIPGCAMG